MGGGASRQRPPQPRSKPAVAVQGRRRSSLGFSGFTRRLSTMVSGNYKTTHFEPSSAFMGSGDAYEASRPSIFPRESQWMSWMRPSQVEGTPATAEQDNWEEEGEDDDAEGAPAPANNDRMSSALAAGGASESPKVIEK